MKMKLMFALLGLALATGTLTGQQKDVKEQTIDLTPFGFHGGSCSGKVYFLDDNRLILSTPLMKKCGKDTWWKAKPTRLTVIDLNGKAITTKDRADVVETHTGPLGYATVCTENSIELISGDLNKAIDIPIKDNPCFRIGDVSPSRTAIEISGRLFQGASPNPIAEVHPTKGSQIVGITDTGFAICSLEGYLTCAHFTVNGVDWKGDSLWEQNLKHVLFLTPQELLLPDDIRTQPLAAVHSDGTQTQISYLSKLRPPYINTINLSISAVAPRRILYYVTGCHLGDFDDCFFVTYHKFAVFDSQTDQTLLQHDVDGDSGPIISPNGHIVADLDGADLHLYNIP
jgi:hypothetical protein